MINIFKTIVNRKAISLHKSTYLANILANVFLLKNKVNYSSCLHIIINFLYLSIIPYINSILNKLTYIII